MLQTVQSDKYYDRKLTVIRGAFLIIMSRLNVCHFLVVTLQYCMAIMHMTLTVGYVYQDIFLSKEEVFIDIVQIVTDIQPRTGYQISVKENIEQTFANVNVRS